MRTAFSVAPKKVPDLEIPFDPLEERFDLPAFFIKIGGLVRWRIEIVGDQADDLAGGDAHGDLAYRMGQGIAAPASDAPRQEADAVSQNVASHFGHYLDLGVALPAIGRCSAHPRCYASATVLTQRCVNTVKGARAIKLHIAA